ncbi:GNAT family N-acetyltransferase [Gellertiella hungarica]|uniref:RimJ/RimL family protein N-acetyltransferase n=1 Tax=Gellertiella hungarica TaxID=1572859 RepID=A0A7W6NLD6_9HYPH|nr:GNAT family N-acetyltransferase [Gellertiella hungarica]MBB4065454.1 RimJ/RimL family protein N-acetyltransferase [Gellertiella hungarica]
MIAPRTFQDCRGGFALPWLTEIRTARLHLRSPVLEDAEAIADGLGRFAVARMLPSLPFPYDRQDALEWLLPRASGVQSGWAFAIARENGPLMGIVSIERSGDRWVLGYWLSPPYWGQRLASEAVEAVVDAFFAHAPGESLHASVLSDNPASFSLQSRMGFRITGCREVYCQARGAMKTLIETVLDADDVRRTA